VVLWQGLDATAGMVCGRGDGPWELLALWNLWRGGSLVANGLGRDEGIGELWEFGMGGI